MSQLFLENDNSCEDKALHRRLSSLLPSQKLATTYVMTYCWDRSIRFGPENAQNVQCKINRNSLMNGIHIWFNWELFFCHVSWIWFDLCVVYFKNVQKHSQLHDWREYYVPCKLQKRWKCLKFISERKWLNSPEWILTPKAPSYCRRDGMAIEVNVSTGAFCLFPHSSPC